MKKISLMILLFAGFLSSGCSGAFWGGTATGVGATGAAYEVRAKQQLDRVESDYKAGKIDQKEYEIRKDQISRGSVVY